MNKAYFKALRPHQWLKNSLLFVPMLSAQKLGWPTLSASLLGAAAFSFVASAVYVINDLSDIEADRAHPRKCNRPFASGAIPTSQGPWMAGALLILGGALGAGLSFQFLAVLSFYLAATTSYTFYFKRQMVFDIFGLAGLYSLRIFAGGIATGIYLSVWLLAFSVFIFLSLAAIKRLAELIESGNRNVDELGGRGYRISDKDVIGQIAMASGFAAVVVLATYINAPEVFALYRSPTALWGICLSVLFWITRTAMITHRGDMDDDPLLYAVRDPISLLCFAFMIFSALWAKYM